MLCHAELKHRCATSPLQTVQRTGHGVDVVFNGGGHRVRDVRVAARAAEFAGEITRQIADAFQARDELPSQCLQAATRGNRAADACSDRDSCDTSFTRP